jgi:hypothetical protein
MPSTQGPAGEIWDQGYHTNWTQREGTWASSMSRPTRPEDLGHDLTNCCNFCCIIVKTSIDYWQINDENIHFHPWNQTFTEMKPTTLTYQIKHFDLLNQSLSSIKSITFIEINNILGDTRMNSQRLSQLLETI